MKPTTIQKTAFLDLLRQVLAYGKKKHVYRKEKELAHRLGISQETLSRMKARGNADFATLDKMAHMVGLRLALVPINTNDTAEAIRQGNFF